ncbi:TonB-dependent receptor plug domain-containing protein [Porphyromonas macacae]|uniref:Outer membrane cobalamin receptor protein n=1 Tax=Porphyromonas macacae TaxID=28115 RepID=A0A379DKJ8_9PORP|nr:carboxypeptidase-like regulatory domain-containing protein [Porphyromonas macacae]SUB78275.1 Outer membrane cobalamin receptor protein [Porphyromonas macacae]
MKRYIQKSLLWLFFTLFILFSSFAQLEITGKITDEHGKPVHFANVRVPGSFDGSSSDSLGKFLFVTNRSLPLTLIASHLNYRADTLVLSRESACKSIFFKLRELPSHRLQEVVVSVSAFSVGSVHTRTALKAMDIYTNPSGNGDLGMGMRQIPGLQDVGDREGFFVRGGDAAETVVVIDGVRVSNFFGQSNPDNPARSRFPAGLFSGMSLVTGGFGVSDGGALSGLLKLNLSGASPSFWNVGISPLFVNGGGGWQSRSGKIYLEQQLSYTNSAYVALFLKPEFRLNGTNCSVASVSRVYWQSAEKDVVKALFMYNREEQGSFHLSPDAPDRTVYRGDDNYVFGMFNWLRRFTPYSSLEFSGGYSFNDSRLGESFREKSLFDNSLHNHYLQAHVKMQHNLPGIRYVYGLDYLYSKVDLSFIYKQRPLNLKVRLPELAAYAEVSSPAWHNGFISAGLRTEYSPGHAMQWLPRISLTQKIFPRHTITFDTGLYAAFGDYLRYGVEPEKREKVAQYNLTYEWRPGNFQILRLQVYDKEYRRLHFLSDAGQVLHTGKGYARGVDFFWKGGGLIKNMEHWVSYSFTDAQRTLFFSSLQEQPGFVARHTGSLVLKYWWSRLSSLFNVSFTYRSGMKYHNPNLRNGSYMNEETPSNLNMSASYNYPFKRGRVNGVLVLSAHNLFNSNPTYGYRYSQSPQNGVYNAVRITSPYKQFYMVALFLNIGVDRRNEIMNTNLKINNR